MKYSSIRYYNKKYFMHKVSTDMYINNINSNESKEKNMFNLLW